MPLHAQIVCIGGNALIGLLLLFAGLAGASEGGFGMTVFMLAMAGSCAYTIWVLLKFRTYLGEEAMLERELNMERLRDELAVAKADGPTDTSVH